MNILWTDHALSDLARLYEFLAPVHKSAAAKVVQGITASVAHLAKYPRIGHRLNTYNPREVRRLISGHYEIRYEIHDGSIYVLRLWHTRENR
jgi:plasmid stabilization system protein ParE